MEAPLLSPGVACLLCAVLGVLLGVLVGTVRAPRVSRRLPRRRG